MNNKKILVIEDEPDIQDLIREELEEEGYEVITASDGAEGIKKAIEKQPHLITLDMHMEPIDGELVFHTLRRDKKTCKIPIILVSVYEKGKDDLKIDANGYIKKPFKMKEFIDKISEVLNKNEK